GAAAQQGGADAGERKGAAIGTYERCVGESEVGVVGGDNPVAAPAACEGGEMSPAADVERVAAGAAGEVGEENTRQDNGAGRVGQAAAGQRVGHGGGKAGRLACDGVRAAIGLVGEGAAGDGQGINRRIDLEGVVVGPGADQEGLQARSGEAL